VLLRGYGNLRLFHKHHSHLGDETPIGSTYEARPLCRCVAASPLEALEQTASTWVSGGNMDTDRRLADWSRLRGTCRWLFVHLAVVMCFREEQ
jgi:hypothetical protein